MSLQMSTFRNSPLLYITSQQIRHRLDNRVVSSCGKYLAQSKFPIFCRNYLSLTVFY